MYKLTILFFFLTAFSSNGLMDNYKITFEYDYASYILNIKDGELTFENNQPYVKVMPIGDNADNTDKAPPNGSGKIYKITKGATFEEGLKIGGIDGIDIEAKIGGADDIDIEAKIGEMDGIDAEGKIGGMDDIDVEGKIGEADDIDIEAKIGGIDGIDVEGKIGGIDGIDVEGKIHPLLSGEKDHQAYDIILSYALVTVVEKSSNVKQQFAIGDDGLFVYINGSKFNLFRI